MDLLQLKYMVAIADNESMTKAAEQLFVSQSALSLSYRRLEAELGLKLYIRKGRTLALTDAGKHFYEKAVVILRQMDSLSREMALFRTADTMNVVYSSEVGDFTNVSMVLYNKVFPERQQLELREDESETLKQLRQGTVPFAVTCKEVPDPLFVSELLLEEPVYALVHEDSPLNVFETLSLDQLAAYPLICQREGFAVSEMMLGFFRTAGLSPAGILRVGDPESLSLHVHNGSGITFIPESVVNYWKRSPSSMAPGCCMIPMKEPYCTRKVHLVYPRNTVFHVAVEHYMNYLRQFAALTQKNHCFPSQEELMEYTALHWPGFCVML